MVVASATDPLEVRFSVRQHESILVVGSTVRQGPESELNQVPGDIVSSTDNPTTFRETLPGLEMDAPRSSFHPFPFRLLFSPSAT